MASIPEAKNSTFSSLGFFALQVGRQKMPVVLTPVTNKPSKEESRCVNARNISAMGGSFFMPLILICGDTRATDFQALNFSAWRRRRGDSALEGRGTAILRNSVCSASARHRPVQPRQQAVHLSLIHI